MRTPLIAALGLLVLPHATPAHAAVSCSLNDPDRDVRREFPESTGYRTEFHSIQAEGGAAFRMRFEALYGRPLDAYSEVDIQHAFYPVLKGKELIGHLFGATQTGKYGSLQVIAVVSPNGTLDRIYYQKLSAPYAKQLKDESFTLQFRGLTLADFEGWQADPDYAGLLTTITPPSEESAADVLETIWGLKKVLMLFDHYYREDQALTAWEQEA